MVISDRIVLRYLTIGVGVLTLAYLCVLLKQSSSNNNDNHDGSNDEDDIGLMVKVEMSWGSEPSKT